MNTIYTLLNADNRGKVIAAFCGIIVILSTYTGTLPASLQNHKDWINLLAAIVTGLSLIHVDPKREL